MSNYQNNIYGRTYETLRKEADRLYVRYLEGMGTTFEEALEADTIAAKYALDNEKYIFTDLPPKQQQKESTWHKL